MTFYVQELCDAIRDLLDGAALTYAPKIVQVGGLEYYPESADISQDLPALFIEPLDMAAETDDVGGTQYQEVHLFRVLICDSWDPGEVVMAKKIAHAKEVWNLLDATSLDFGATIAGWTNYYAHPTGVTFNPPEELALSINETRRVFCAVVKAIAVGVAER